MPVGLIDDGGLLETIAAPMCQRTEVVQPERRSFELTEPAERALARRLNKVMIEHRRDGIVEEAAAAGIEL
jgi:hypothetical protein